MLNNSLYSMSAIKEKLHSRTNPSQFSTYNATLGPYSPSKELKRTETMSTLYNKNTEMSQKTTVRPKSSLKRPRSNLLLPCDEFFRSRVCDALQLNENKLTEKSTKQHLEAK